MKRRILMLFLLLSVCSCTFFSLNSVSFFPAQSQWQASDIQDYEAVIQVNLPLSASQQYRSVVRNGNIVETGRRGGNLGLGLPIENERGFAPESFEPIDPTEIDSFTIEGLMSLVNDSIGNTFLAEIRPCRGYPPYYDAEYDAQYGYVSSLRFNSGGGLFGCQIADAWGSYTVLSFIPLSP